MRLGAPVALHQALRGERAAVHGVRVGVVQLAQLERVDAELCRQLVEDALERPGSLDEPGRAEGGHRRDVQLGAVLDRPDVLAGVEQLRRPCRRRQPARPAERAGVLAAERGQRPVGPSRRGHALARGVAVAADDVLLAPGERAAHRAARPLRQLGREENVIADAGLGPEAAAHELADHPHLVLAAGRGPRPDRGGYPRCTGSRRRRRGRRHATRRRTGASRAGCGSASASCTRPRRRRRPGRGPARSRLARSVATPGSASRAPPPRRRRAAARAPPTRPRSARARPVPAPVSRPRRPPPRRLRNALPPRSRPPLPARRRRARREPLPPRRGRCGAPSRARTGCAGARSRASRGA